MPVTVSETLQSTGVNLPEDLLADDNTLIYRNGKPVRERNDFDDEIEDDSRHHTRCVNLALDYYNRLHQTDYKVLPKGKGSFFLTTSYTATSVKTHIGFDAAYPDCPAKYFCSKLFQPEYDVEPVVTSCKIVDGIHPIGCYFCDRRAARCPSYPYLDEEEKEKDTSVESDDVPPQSEYCHVLADGVSLSDRAKLRLKYTLIALSHYNTKNRTDYKLVDVLPYCTGINQTVVAHCNFIAKQSDSKNELFFAEVKSLMEDRWAVTYCRIMRGKTRAGCNLCPDHLGKRVIHPMRGFRFGVYPEPGFRRTGPRLRSSGPIYPTTTPSRSPSP